MSQRPAETVVNGRERARAAAAPASPWPPPVGLLDPRNDARSWRLAGVGGDLRPAPEGGAEEAPGMVVARGKMVHLRTLTRADLVHLSRWADDPALEHLVGSDFLRMYREVYDRSESFYDACLADPTQIALMVVPNEGWPGPVGLVRLFNIHVLDGYAGLEIIIADRRAQRRGLGVQAGRLVSFYGVDVLGLRRIESRAYAYNRLSINGLLRNGFRQEGVLRQASFKDGKYWDIVIFGILREEIEIQRQKDRYLVPGPGEAPAVEPP